MCCSPWVAGHDRATELKRIELELQKIFVDSLIFMKLLQTYLFVYYFYFDDYGSEQLNVNCSVS